MGTYPIVDPTLSERRSNRRRNSHVELRPAIQAQTIDRSRGAAKLSILLRRQPVRSSLEHGKAIVVYTRGSRFLEGTPIPPSFDHQAPYLDFWLRLIGVRDLRSVIVDNAWNRDRRESEVSLASGKAALEKLVDWFLAS